MTFESKFDVTFGSFRSPSSNVAPGFPVDIDRRKDGLLRQLALEFDGVFVRHRPLHSGRVEGVLTQEHVPGAGDVMKANNHLIKRSRSERCADDETLSTRMTRHLTGSLCCCTVTTASGLDTRRR